MGSYHVTLKRARVVALLEENKILDEFINELWPFGKTEKGQKHARRLRRIYDRWTSGSEGGAETEAEDEDLEETSFALEEHLREYLKNNLHAFEKGLRLFKDKEGKEGIEYPVDTSGRRIDILAIDKAGIPVVVELKVSRGHEKALGQALYYRSRAKQLLSSRKARIVLVDREITPELQLAAEGLPEVELFQYKLSFKLEKL